MTLIDELTDGFVMYSRWKKMAMSLNTWSIWGRILFADFTYYSPGMRCIFDTPQLLEYLLSAGFSENLALLNISFPY